jgi:urease accessory protein
MPAVADFPPTHADTAPDRVESVPPPARSSGWAASLQLDFARRAGATHAIRREHRGPLRVQRMLYPEGPDCCHALLLHPPAGIAGGDTLDIAIDVQPRAHALITTPGAAKWYRSAGAWARQDLRLQVADDACLEWLPQEAILFDGARARQRCEIVLAPRASMFGWDIVQLGRIHSGEAWLRGSWQQALSIRRGDRVVWLERASLDAHDALRTSPLGLAGQPVFATAWACGPALAGDIDAALAAARGVAAEHGVPHGLTWLTAPTGLLLIRALGPDATSVRALLEALWHTLKPWTAGRPAARPRIWNT